MADLRSPALPRVNRGFILRISSIAALGGVLYGYDMGIIAAAALFVKRSFALSTIAEELVVSIVLIGAMTGAIVGGAIADRIGRRAADSTSRSRSELKPVAAAPWFGQRGSSS